MERIGWEISESDGGVFVLGEQVDQVADPALELSSRRGLCRQARVHLESCLPSVQAQSYPNLEILLVDNQTTDDSVELFAAARSSLNTVFEYTRFSATSPPRKSPSSSDVLTRPPPL